MIEKITLPIIVLLLAAMLVVLAVTKPNYVHHDKAVECLRETDLAYQYNAKRPPCISLVLDQTDN